MICFSQIISNLHVLYCFLHTCHNCQCSIYICWHVSCKQGVSVFNKMIKQCKTQTTFNIVIVQMILYKVISWCKKDWHMWQLLLFSHHHPWPTSHCLTPTHSCLMSPMTTPSNLNISNGQLTHPQHRPWPALSISTTNLNPTHTCLTPSMNKPIHAQCHPLPTYLCLTWPKTNPIHAIYQLWATPSIP